MSAVPTDAVPPDGVPSQAALKPVVPGNSAADRLIAAGQRPRVLGAVEVRTGDDLADALFAALAHLSNGADGIDLTLPAAWSPAERLPVADQFAEATGVALYLRTEVPMACGVHTPIVSATVSRLRASLKAMYDIGLDATSGDSIECSPAWPEHGDERSLLLSTTGFADLGDAALMGLASAASVRGISAVSTDRPRIVRRVVDTLAPLCSTAPNAGETSCH